MTIPATTEHLRTDVLQIRQELRDGKISNAVARTLLHAAKIALDTLRTEMDATRLGCEFTSVHFTQVERHNGGSLKRAA